MIKTEKKRDEIGAFQEFWGLELYYEKWLNKKKENCKSSTITHPKSMETSIYKGKY